MGIIEWMIFISSIGIITVGLILELIYQIFKGRGIHGK